MTKVEAVAALSTALIVFLDFEASSLSKKSVPIEVAWVFEDGRSRSTLIRPAPDWDDWAADAEAIHHISRDMLAADGLSVGEVAAEMFDVLAGHDLYASAPSWDGKWLSALLRAGGLPRHALRLAKSDEAFRAAARRILGVAASEADITSLVEQTIRQSEPETPVHRALPDAMLELERWKLVQAAAMSALA